MDADGQTPSPKPTNTKVDSYKIIAEILSIGYIRERATWFYPVFHIFSNDGTREMKVRGLPCHDLCCEDVLYSVTNMDGATVSTITRKWLGCCREALLDVDQFIVTFHKDLSTAEKALILASTFLIELIYYEYA